MSLTIALAGNPNSGKTTLFNALTGSNQSVGNWPGVTVEKKEGQLKGRSNVQIMDLPGIYSLSPYTLEEVVTRNYLLHEKPDAILNIVDATNIERNLYLTTQLMELGIPVIITLNMMDLVRKNGDQIDISALAAGLGCSVVEISALKGQGVFKAADQAIQAGQQQKPLLPKPVFSQLVEETLSTIMESLGAEIPTEQQRFCAVKVFERDEKIREQIVVPPNIELLIQRVEQVLGDDAESIMANERYTYITSVIAGCYQKKDTGYSTTSDKIDQVLTNRWLALPIFALVMFIVYYVSVTSVGSWVTGWTNEGLFGEAWSFFGYEVPGIPVLVQNGLEAVHCADWLQSLIIDGIIGGVGAVLGFVPQILVLFVFLAFLEGCGYMARVAFIMDRLFRKFGLSGKSFIPMLIGTGCGVPGIMASRTIENEKDRRMTIMTTTFIPCSAKLPIIALISGALFAGAWWVAPSAYFVGIAAIVCSGVMLKKTRIFSGVPSPFVMELPAYHLPTLTNVLRSMWERGWSYIKKAGTIVLLSTMVIWFASNFGYVGGHFVQVEDLSQGFLANIGSAIAWIFSPLGFGDWKSTVATITGLIAKENIVGTFGVLYGFAEVAEDGMEIWETLAISYTTAAAYAFLVFNLLCAPCFAAIGAIRREMNSGRWTWFALGYQTLFAYSAAFCIYQFGTWVTTGIFGILTGIAVCMVLFFLYLFFRRDPQQTSSINQKLG